MASTHDEAVELLNAAKLASDANAKVRSAAQVLSWPVCCAAPTCDGIASAGRHSQKRSGARHQEEPFAAHGRDRFHRCDHAGAALRSVTICLAATACAQCRAAIDR